MSWVKMEFYEDGKVKSVEMHCLLISGKIKYPDKKEEVDKNE